VSEAVPVFVTVTVYVRVLPDRPLSERGEIETSMPGGFTQRAMQLTLSVTAASAREVAVTVIVVESPSAAVLGMVTLSCAVSDAPGASGPTVSLERLGDQLGTALSLLVKVYVSEAVPVFVTVTVYVRVLPDRPLLEVCEIETSTPGGFTQRAMQLTLSVTAALAREVAVTVIVWLAPLAVPEGMVTLSVTEDDTLGGSGPTELWERLGDQLTLSLTVKS
jgi:hypothetical protein